MKNPWPPRTEGVLSIPPADGPRPAPPPPPPMTRREAVEERVAVALERIANAMHGRIEP